MYTTGSDVRQLSTPGVRPLQTPQGQYYNQMNNGMMNYTGGIATY